MEGIFITVPVTKIVSISDRKYGGKGNIDVLAGSIKQDGLAHPPLVTDCGDGTYRVIAGRRRIEAVRRLGWPEVTVKVVSEADEGKLAALALAENVNRRDMHPLDEAQTFKSLLGKFTVKEIADYYDRNISGIYHRVRLCDLRDEIKEMFREEKLNLSGAALLASLPDEDQETFYNNFKNKEGSIPAYEIERFIHKVQHHVLKHVEDDECKKCKKRTNNTDPGLFEDIRDVNDVCFDEDCFARKWKSLIEKLIEEHGGKTDTKLILASGVPRFYPKKTKTLTIGEKEYELLYYNKVSVKETGKKTKSDTAWLLQTWPDLKISRVQWKKRESDSYQNYNNTPDLVRNFMLDCVPEIPEDAKKEIGNKLQQKYPYSNWKYVEKIKTPLLRDIILKRIKEKSRENMAVLFLKEECSGASSDGVWEDFLSDADYALFKEIMGTDSIDSIPETPLTQELFLFIIARSFQEVDMPDINDTDKEWEITEKSLFWKFAQMSREEYIGQYRVRIQKVIAEEIATEDSGDYFESDDHERFFDDIEDAGEFAEDFGEEHPSDDGT
jgi:ParB family chromosome partitioning protein